MAEEKSIVPRLICTDLKHKYGTVPVLDGISFTVSQGQTLAIMGKSGSGKSTLLRCLNLLEQPLDGDIRLEGQVYMQHGKALFALWQIRSQIGMVFQDYNLFPNMTCLQNLTLALEKTKLVARRDANNIAMQIGTKLGIDHLLNRYPETLSGGQAQRLALARALVLQPSVLLLDEITAALDPESIANVVGTIRQIRELEEGRHLAIVLVTHLLSLAIHFADSIAYLSQGIIVDNHPSREFINLASHPETLSFIKNSMEY